MKKIIYKTLSVLAAIAVLQSCSLDEYNPTQIDGDETLSTYDGWKGLLNYCYTPLYDQMFSASDYLFVAEAGTDTWLTANNKTNTQQLFYYEGLTTSTNATNKLFLQAYAMINSCNAVINRAENVEGDASKVKTLKGEAHTLRAYYYLILVTQYGPVTLKLDESSSNVEMIPQRNTIEEVYAQIVDDLKIAAETLNVNPMDDNYARISKKTALGLLARTYAQGAGEGLSENGVSYWQRAKEVAEDLIANMGSYGAAMYDDVADVWAHANNRNNKEVLFVASGPQAGTDSFLDGAYSANKLFTFTFTNPNKLSDLYTVSDRANYFYGRVNNNLLAPSKYLIDCFSDYDKRWENSFVTAFAHFSMEQPDPAWATYESRIQTLTSELCTKYGIDPSFVGRKIYPYADVDAISYTIGGSQYVASVWPKGEHSGDISKLEKTKNVYVHPYPLDADEDRFLVYLSKNPLTAAEKAQRGYFCVNIDDLFDSDLMYKSSSFDGTESYQLFPSLSKFNWSYQGLFYGSNLQCKTGDMFIMRMAEVYLIAAEANQMLGNETKAAEYLNVLRKRACRNEADYEVHMKLTTATEEDVLDEYARELCGEFSRWALLKRHKAFESRLSKYNKRAYRAFDANKNYLRPVSYDFLSQIDNSEEYGDNGYGTTASSGLK